MSQTSANVIAGDDARASDFNKVVADIAEIYAGGPGVPIGGVIWFWSDNTVPLNYKVADGTVVSDGSSPLNGLTTVNLINRFIRGVANSNLRSVGVSGGEDTHVLTFSEMPQHNHPILDPGHSHGLQTFQPHFPNQSAFNVNDFSGDAIASLDNAVGGVNGDWYNSRYGTYGAGTGIQTGLQGDNQPHNNIPNYRGLVPIMRIK